MPLSTDYKHAYMHINMHAYIHAYIHTCIYTCIYTYVNRYIHAYIHACIYIYIYIYMHIYIHAYKHTCRALVMQHVDDNQHMMKLKENTERFLRAMAEAGKHDMLLGLIETKTDFDINGQFVYGHAHT